MSWTTSSKKQPMPVARSAERLGLQIQHLPEEARLPVQPPIPPGPRLEGRPEVREHRDREGRVGRDLLLAARQARERRGRRLLRVGRGAGLRGCLPDAPRRTMAGGPRGAPRARRASARAGRGRARGPPRGGRRRPGAPVAPRAARPTAGRPAAERADRRARRSLWPGARWLRPWPPRCAAGGSRRTADTAPPGVSARGRGTSAPVPARLSSAGVLGFTAAVATSAIAGHSTCSGLRGFGVPDHVPPRSASRSSGRPSSILSTAASISSPGATTTRPSGCSRSSGAGWRSRSLDRGRGAPTRRRRRARRGDERTSPARPPRSGRRRARGPRRAGSSGRPARRTSTPRASGWTRGRARRRPRAATAPACPWRAAPSGARGRGRGSGSGGGPPGCPRPRRRAGSPRSGGGCRSRGWRAAPTGRRRAPSTR